MPSFLSPDDLALPESASPGLDTLPPETQDSGSLGLASMTAPTTPSLPVSTAAPVVDHSTIASKADQERLSAPPVSDEQAYINSLPPLQKMAMALGEFDAALGGRPGPVQIAMEGKRKRDAEVRQELGAIAKTLHENMDTMKGVDPAVRGPMAAMLARPFGKDAAAVQAALMSSGTQAGKQVEDFISATTKSPAAQAFAIKSVAGSAHPMEELSKNFRDKDWKDQFYQIADRDIMDGMTQKMNVISKTLMAKYPDGFTRGQLEEANKQLPPELNLDTGELGLIERKQPVIAGLYGMVTDQTVQKRQERKETGDKSATEVGKLNDDLANGNITQAQYDAEIKRRNLSVDKQNITITNQDNARLDEETTKDMAKQYLAGDKSVLQNLGRGNQGAQNLIALRKAISQEGRAQGLTPEGIAVKIAEFEGLKAGERTASTREAQLGFAAHELENFIPLAQAASAKVPRTDFVPLNKLIQAGESAWSPEQAAFVAANRAVVNSFSMVASRGVQTVHNVQESEKMLNTAATHDQYTATLKQLDQEVKAAMKAPKQVRADLADRTTGTTSDTATPGATDIATQVRAAGSTYEPAKYDYKVVNGKVFRKPK